MSLSKVYTLSKKINGKYTSIYNNVDDIFSAAFEDAVKNNSYQNCEYLVLLSFNKKTARILVSTDQRLSYHDYIRKSTNEHYLIGFDGSRIIKEYKRFMGVENQTPLILKRMMERIKSYDL